MQETWCRDRKTRCRVSDIDSITRLFLFTDLTIACNIYHQTHLLGIVLHLFLELIHLKIYTGRKLQFPQKKEGKIKG